MCRSRSQTSGSPRAPRRGHQPRDLPARRLAARPTAWTSCTPCVPPAPPRGLLAARRAACYSRAPYQPCAGVRQARTRVCQCGGAMGGGPSDTSSCSTRLATCPLRLKHLPRVCLPGTLPRGSLRAPGACPANLVPRRERKPRLPVARPCRAPRGEQQHVPSVS